MLTVDIVGLPAKQCPNCKLYWHGVIDNENARLLKRPDGDFNLEVFCPNCKCFVKINRFYDIPEGIDFTLFRID
jgi:phage FluMu protein Com